MKKKSYPRVLVISHTVLDKSTNMGKTIAMLFNGWDSENIAQLFLRNQVPSLDKCKKYYRITDFDILKAFFTFKKTENIIDGNYVENKNSTQNDSGVREFIYQYGRKKKPYMYLLRNLLWRTKKWNTHDLEVWLDNFNPEIVFYASGSSSFSIRLALEICKKRNIPMVVYFADEYYFLNINKYSIINLINRFEYKKIFKEMFDYLSSFIAISDKMQKKYTKEFKKPGYTIMTPTSISNTSISNNRATSTQSIVSYIGNLGMNRCKSLVEIGLCLKEMGFILNVYSLEKRKSVIKQMNLDNGIKFHGAISGEEVNKVIKSSTIVIHVESMDEINRQRARYSISTKIAESLGSGTCLFAYGPDDVFSIKYLIENDAACVVSKKEDLQIKLKEILKDEDLRKKYINNALELAKKNHNIHLNNELLYKIITEACYDYQKS